MFQKIRMLLFISLLGLGLGDCKKYPDGGLHAVAFKHLLTKDNECWKLELYEVDGLDSTNLFVHPNGEANFYNCFMYILQDGKRSKDMYLSNYRYRYHCRFDDQRSQLLFKTDNQSFDTIQREIFNPEKVIAPAWKIQRLKKDEVTFTAQWSKSYKIKLNKHKL